MNKIVKDKSNNGEPYWKVRIYIRRCGIMHLITKTEPRIKIQNGCISPLCFDIVEKTQHGDSLAYLDWSEVGAISWRYSECDDQEDKVEA